MRIITVLGSPKKTGNTATALKMFEKTMADNGHTINRINIADHKINGCLGCNLCFSSKEHANCIQKDDVDSLFNQIIDEADLVIYATPLYAHSFPSQMKAFIDRHFCLVTNPGLANQSSLIENKRVALLVTCCNPESTTDLIQESFDRIFGELRCDICGKYIIPLSANPSYIERAQEKVNSMSEEILAKI